MFTGYTADCNTARYVTHSQAVKTDELLGRAQPGQEETVLTHGPRAATGTMLQSEQKVERISKRNYRRRSKIPEVIFFSRVVTLKTNRKKSQFFCM